LPAKQRLTMRTTRIAPPVASTNKYLKRVYWEPRDGRDIKVAIENTW